jgi:hypothetical protein
MMVQRPAWFSGVGRITPDQIGRSGCIVEAVLVDFGGRFLRPLLFSRDGGNTGRRAKILSIGGIQFRGDDNTRVATAR